MYPKNKKPRLTLRDLSTRGPRCLQCLCLKVINTHLKPVESFEEIEEILESDWFIRRIEWLTNPKSTHSRFVNWTRREESLISFRVNDSLGSFRTDVEWLIEDEFLRKMNIEEVFSMTDKFTIANSFILPELYIGWLELNLKVPTIVATSIYLTHNSKLYTQEYEENGFLKAHENVYLSANVHSCVF